MNYREAARKLRLLGCHELNRKTPGSHRSWFNPASQGITSLPDWGGMDLRLGTLRTAIRQLGLDWQDFKNA